MKDKKSKWYMHLKAVIVLYFIILIFVVMHNNYDNNYDKKKDEYLRNCLNWDGWVSNEEIKTYDQCLEEFKEERK